jgi:hypothetical protein
VGIRNALRLIADTDSYAAQANRPAQGIVSPWQTGQLSQIVWSDIFGTEAAVVTREEAMTVPAVVKARNIIAGQVARFPLRAYDVDGETPTQPEWLQGTASQISPYHRMLWTVDDLVMFGWSLWGVERDEAGQIIAAERCPIERWQVRDTDNAILIDGVHAEEGSVILIPGPHEGLLTLATRTIRGAARLEHGWISKALNPIPAIELHQTTDDPLETDEIVALVQAWADARSDTNGAIAYTPHNIEARAHGDAAPSLFIEGRNFVRIDIGAFLGIPAALMDASLSTASLTYSTQQGQQNEFFNATLPMWLNPIEQRLSLDDVVPSGQRVRFDLAELFTIPQSPTGPITQD